MKHIYFAKTINVHMIGGKEMYWLIQAHSKDEALKILGIKDENDEEFGFITELTPEVEFTRQPKWDKVKLFEYDY